MKKSIKNQPIKSKPVAKKRVEVTLALLRRAHACEDEVYLFEETFGESAVITRNNLIIAKEAGLSIDWLLAHGSVLRDAILTAWFGKMPIRGDYLKLSDEGDVVRFSNIDLDGYVWVSDHSRKSACGLMEFEPTTYAFTKVT